MKQQDAAIGIALILALAAVPASANDALAKAKNCTACHSADRKLIGPAFKLISMKYKEDKSAVEKLAKKVRGGGVGVWGKVPMPANPQVDEAEATTLVKWILSH